MGPVGDCARCDRRYPSLPATRIPFWGREHDGARQREEPPIGRTLGRVLWRPVFMTLPRFALRMMFGDIADAVLLASMRGEPTKLVQSSFEFDHPDLEP